MRNYQIKYTALIVLLIIFSFCACNAQDAQSHSIEYEEDAQSHSKELWVVTERTDRYGMNSQAQKLATQFEKTHKNVSVRIDILPENGEERETYLEQLRTEIMAGKGPDIYLLPVTSYRSTEQLFQDVTQCMYNGIFCDISEFYESDAELNTEGLVTAVMDAGTIGDARYVLPLRYDLPVAYVNNTLWEETGMNKDIFNFGITALWEAALDSGDVKLVYGMYGIQDAVDLSLYSMNFFSEIFDYKNQELVLTAEELSLVLNTYQDIRTLCGDFSDYLTPQVSTYCLGNSWMERGYSVYFGSLSEAMMNAAFAEQLDIDLSMYPIRSLDGTVIADVMYYGAVDSSCNYPELAYEYLRLFLTEESQWEDNRLDTSEQPHKGLIARGWPVRAVGGTAKLWNIIKSQYTGFEYADATAEFRRKSLQKVWLSEESLPILYTEIDMARFSIEVECELANRMLSNISASTTEADLDTMAEEIIQLLRWHVAEG